jgi:LCP family protein required for cell wall assembly
MFSMKKHVRWTIFFLILAAILISSSGQFVNPANHFYIKNISSFAFLTPYKQGNYFNQKPLPKTKNKNAPETLNFLILGIDTRNTADSRADMIMVANINPLTKVINLVSIPRDTKIEVAGFGFTKINHTHMLGEIKGGNLKGTQATLNAVANMLQCQIKYYVKVDFQGFINFIDILGGLDIELPKPVKLTFKSMTLPSGINHLDGNMTLELTRERYSLNNGDFGRQQNQLMILKAMAKQMLSATNIRRLSEFIFRARQQVVDTNLTTIDLLSLAWLLRQIPESNINYYQMKGKSESGLDPLTKTVVYYWRPNIENIRQIQKHFQ